MSGFKDHIREAIAINRARKVQYGQLTNRKSIKLSNALLGLEYLCLPLASYFDTRAKSYNKRGIRIVIDDFVEMEIPEFSSPIKKCLPFQKSHAEKIKNKVKQFLKLCPKRLRNLPDLEDASRLARELLNQIQYLATKYRIYLATLEHLIESYILIIENGMKYFEQSKGQSIKLTSDIAYVHRIGIKNALKIDLAANRFHIDGVGIIVNDLPKIL